MKPKKRSKEQLKHLENKLKRYVSYMERNMELHTNQLKRWKRRLTDVTRPFSVHVTNQILDLKTDRKCDICHKSDCDNLQAVYTHGNKFVRWTVAGWDCLRTLHDEKVPVHAVLVGYGGADDIGLFFDIMDSAMNELRSFS